MEFIRKQQAGGRETGKDAGVNGGLSGDREKGCGWKVGGRSLAGQRVVTVVPQLLPMVRATARP